MRAGKITASRCSDLMTKGRGEDFGATAKTYAKELALKQLGYYPDSYTSWEMEWGIEHESDARDIYSESRGVTVDMPGFIEINEYVGCTPDGLVESDGMLEIKCPQWKAHVEYIMEGAPKQYWQQMQFQMMVCNRKWCDFMTFHPDFPDGLKAKVFRIERDQDYIDLINERIEKFKVIIKDYKNKLTSL